MIFSRNFKKRHYFVLFLIFFIHTYPDLKEFFRLLKGLLSTSLSEFFRLLKGLCCIDTTGLLSTSLSACLRLLGLSKIRSIHGMKCVTLATMYFQKISMAQIRMSHMISFDVQLIMIKI